MSHCVVDSCVAVRWLVPQAGSQAAAEVLRRSLAGTITLLAPDLIDAEVGNALAVRVHRRLMEPQEARGAFARFRHLEVTKVASAQLLDDALQLALEYRRSFYDCLFLALSLQENCPFVTADLKLFNAVGRFFPNLELLTSV
jgi:predicted nucleic acid-binding protein